jgi:hypothetical protein
MDLSADTRMILRMWMSGAIDEDAEVSGILDAFA